MIPNVVGESRYLRRSVISSRLVTNRLFFVFSTGRRIRDRLTLVFIDPKAEFSRLLVFEIYWCCYFLLDVVIVILLLAFLKLYTLVKFLFYFVVLLRSLSCFLFSFARKSPNQSKFVRFLKRVMLAFICHWNWISFIFTSNIAIKTRTRKANLHALAYQWWRCTVHGSKFWNRTSIRHVRVWRVFFFLSECRATIS